MAGTFNMNWGSQNPLLGQSGQPDYMSTLFPTTQGLDMSQGMGAGASGGGGGWGAGINQWLQESGALGSTSADGIKTPGWGGMAMGAAQGIGNLWMGMQQYGLAKDTFNENKRQFALNFDASKKTTNSRLEDRQAARVASNPGAYQSVGDYMKKNGIQ
jgi:hypothetical protein